MNYTDINWNVTKIVKQENSEETENCLEEYSQLSGIEPIILLLMCANDIKDIHFINNNSPQCSVNYVSKLIFQHQCFYWKHRLPLSLYLTWHMQHIYCTYTVTFSENMTLIGSNFLERWHINPYHRKAPIAFLDLHTICISHKSDKTWSMSLKEEDGFHSLDKSRTKTSEVYINSMYHFDIVVGKEDVDFFSEDQISYK